MAKIQSTLLVPFIFLLATTLVGCKPTDSSLISSSSETIYYIVNFESNGGTPVAQQLVAAAEYISIPEVSKEGYSLDGWYTSVNNGLTLDEKWSFVLYQVHFNLTLYAKWLANEYLITFISNGGTTVPSISQEYGMDVVEPADPNKTGYSFIGWYTDDVTFANEYLFSTMPANNLTIYAKWMINQYTISFVNNEGSATTPITQDYATTVSAPLDPTKTGYTFAGWYSNDGLTVSYTFSTMPASNLTLYAKWAINQYSIMFASNGGSSVPSISQDYGTNVVEPSEPIKTGYSFNGWYTDDVVFANEYTFSTMPGNNLTLYAQWSVNQYSLYFQEIESFPTMVVAGHSHSLSLTTSGRVFTWGNNLYGQLGDNTTTQRNAPTEITSRFSLETGDEVISLTAGIYHSMALTSMGRVFTWGNNEAGQLGDNTTTQINVPTEITSRFTLAIGDKVISLFARNLQSMALTFTGRVFTWGYNNAGQLGDDTTVDKLVPTEITSRFSLAIGDKVVSLAGGYSHSLSLTTLGRVFTWGSNDNGQLGDNTTTEKLIPTEITSQFSLAPGDKVVSLTAGIDHSMALTSMGSVFTWGLNNAGQLGDNTTTKKKVPTDITSGFSLAIGDKVVLLSAGYYHSMAVTSLGRTYTFGFNENGELGDDTTIDKYVPTEITSHFFLATSDKVVSLSAGFLHSLALTSMGRVFTWGSNDHGQLGDNVLIDKKVPTENSTLLLSSSLITTEMYDYGANITEYFPLKEGYVFYGWFTDATFTSAYTFSTMPAGDLTLYGYFYPSE